MAFEYIKFLIYYLKTIFREYSGIDSNIRKFELVQIKEGGDLTALEVTEKNFSKSLLASG